MAKRLLWRPRAEATPPSSSSSNKPTPTSWMVANREAHTMIVRGTHTHIKTAWQRHGYPTSLSWAKRHTARSSWIWVRVVYQKNIPFLYTSKYGLKLQLELELESKNKPKWHKSQCCGQKWECACVAQNKQVVNNSRGGGALAKSLAKSGALVGIEHSAEQQRGRRASVARNLQNTKFQFAEVKMRLQLEKIGDEIDFNWHVSVLL